MVMRFGMSEKLGPRTFGHDQSMPFLGREFSFRARLLRRDRARDGRRRSAGSWRRPTRRPAAC